MTAIGLVLLLAGLFIGKAFGSPYSFVHTRADHVAAALFIVGALLLGAGVFVTIWRFMP